MTCTFLVNNKWYADKSATVEDKSVRVVRTAAKLIAAQIQEMQHNTDYYPNAAEMASDSSAVISPQNCRAFQA